jgi:hypothetical protein
MIVVAALAASCSHIKIPGADTAKNGPFFVPTNASNRGPLPVELRRILLLPATGTGDMTEDSLGRVDEAVLNELTRTGKFETVTISRGELQQMFGKLGISSVEALPPDFFEKLGKAYAADGVLFTDVTNFSAYPPLVIGLRMKLARISDHVIWWAADNIFSAADPAVSNAARRHALKLGSDRGPGDLSHTILQNPSRFAGYAVADTLTTLPAR